MVKHPKPGDGWYYPMGIILHTGTQVWVQGCYDHEGHKDVKRVGDGRSNGYDTTGNCILSVPAEWCSYYDEEEAEGIIHCIDADEQLLGYAIG